MRIQMARHATALGMYVKTISGGIALCLATVALPSSGTAADWQLAASTKDYSVFVDVASLQQRRKVVKVWEKISFRTPRQGPKGPYRSTRQFAYFNCREGTFAIKYMTDYSGDDLSGSVVAEYRASGAQIEWTRADPESHAEAVLVFACSKAAKQ